MYILSDQTKQKLGILIEYYRKQKWIQTKDKRWQKTNFLLDDQGNAICSDKTYSKVMRGEALTNDDIYDKLLDKLGEKFVVPGGMVGHLLRMMRRLIEAVEFHDEAGIDRLTLVMMSSVYQYKDIIYYREIHELLCMLRGYFLEGRMITKEEFTKYSELRHVFYPETQTLIKWMLYRYGQHALYDAERLRLLYEELEINQEFALFHRLNKLLMLIESHSFFDARILAREITQRAADTDNQHIKVITMSIDLITTWMASRYEFDDHWRALLDVLYDDTKDISSQVKAKCFVIIGFLMYEANRKESAYQLFRSAIELWPRCYYIVALFLKHIEDVLEYPKEDYSSYEGGHSSELFDVLHQYFRLRKHLELDQMHNMHHATGHQKENLRKLERYLIKEIAPIIGQARRMIHEIFMHEYEVIVRLLHSNSAYRRYMILLDANR